MGFLKLRKDRPATIEEHRKLRDEIERMQEREDRLLRIVIDATWGEALEDGRVPATKKQDWIIAYARAELEDELKRAPQ